MKKRYITILFAFIFLFLNSCVSNQNVDYLSRISEIPAKNFENYTFDPNSNIASRINDTPDLILNYLMTMDNTDNYTSYSISEDEKNQFLEYYNLLPAMNKRIMDEKLIGIYFVNNLYGSALADYVISDDLKLYNILIINPESMKHSITDWLSYRENSCFINSNNQIEVECGDAYTGLLYVLLHESTHIVDYNLSITPFTEYSSFKALNKRFDRNNIFYKEYWDNYNVPRDKYKKEFMEGITFYNLNSGPKIDFADAETIYNELLNTPFISIYSCMSWAEDLAELATWYHFSEILDQPYKINIAVNSDNVIQINPLDNRLVRDRLSVVEQLYE
ncbi:MULTISPECIES: hypothetical protein [unclassified Oceanispirochaeta]|uniref:hypothetical protein n=1 Tax=unclassified Oceanispirochaeta TaxID=2635722 RepID=UPI000E0955B7|nr:MULTISPECIES: hypothetical protein [unclassified Oceanispirochaeta]MBF9018931.1 hypothetical protein [Oceanispirochaeta sp. M2]NPD75430.1 hypothetical protein [Oceanispirochaeta sp. M1]RDG28715.1 hypothetical protein DV872_25390 [Oceanispirochaeta sp. M1]